MWKTKESQVYNKEKRKIVVNRWKTKGTKGKTKNRNEKTTGQVQPLYMKERKNNPNTKRSETSDRMRKPINGIAYTCRLFQVRTRKRVNEPAYTCGRFQDPRLRGCVLVEGDQRQQFAIIVKETTLGVWHLWSRVSMIRRYWRLKPAERL